ncbi:minor tail protein [Mycobacterium phage BTCU-1]|uniref:Putative minor tail protein n=1 Tax=Mycobacterium phage BTCU-1 TaxID=1262532 RepID=R9R4C4_9CAUD|nr:minor tail protein [Mycobacterium phage BTCU-1]AGI61707.1 putative minor tail protein [Mycobacterium phage BTCU-1]
MAKWVMNFKGRAKRNVIITIDKQGARWSGFMDHYRVVREENGDCYLDVVFKHDYEHAKHILVWCNPFLRPELQFPKLWIIFGPAKWCLLLTLFVNILRLETSLWTLPDNPLDPSEWMPLSFNISNWRNIVKPFPLIGDNSNLTIVFSRFQSFHDVAKKTLEDAQLTIVCRRYLKGEDPHPFENLRGELNIGPLEDLLSLIPIRHGCLVWDIIDNSGWGSETAFGGSWLTGFIRAVVNIASDGMTEGIDVFTGDPTYPGEYYTPWFLGTSPQAPWIVFEEGPYTGIKSSEFKYYEATDTSFVAGGESMPGVNEAISAAVNMGGDFLTSLINSALASLGAVGGAIDLPPLGGMMDAVAKPLYENVFLAFQEYPTLRAVGQPLPIPLLETSETGLGDFHYYEAGSRTPPRRSRCRRSWRPGPKSGRPGRTRPTPSRCRTRLRTTWVNPATATSGSDRESGQRFSASPSRTPCSWSGSRRSATSGARTARRAGSWRSATANLRTPS